MKDIFYTNRLIIRKYNKSDIDAYLNVIKNEKIYKTTYAIPKNYSRVQAEKWFKLLNIAFRNGLSYEFGIFDKTFNNYIGNCGIINVNKKLFSGAISYFIDPNFWNNGYASEATKKMLDFAFYELFLMRVSGSCMSTNPASRRVMEKNGFKYEGTARAELFKDGKFLDVDHLAILRHEFVKNNI